MRNVFDRTFARWSVIMPFASLLLTQLASPAGRPGARMLPIDVLQKAFGDFIEYAEKLQGGEHIDADRHMRALPVIRELARLVDRRWELDAVPRDITLIARRAMDAWFPDSGGADFWAQTDRDAEQFRQSPAEPQLGRSRTDNRPHSDEHFLRMALGLREDVEDRGDPDDES